MSDLRELYLASVGGDGHIAPPMALALASSFGSVERWRDQFAAMGKAHAGQPGWVVLMYLPGGGTLVNQWAFEHTGAGAFPLLALDMHQHDGDIDAFLGKLNWAAVAARYSEAVHMASDGLGAHFDASRPAMLLDVRRSGVFELAKTMLPGAQWRDPAAIAHWVEQLPKDREILVYCVRGHEVSRNSAVRMRAHGVDARFLEGGIDAWEAAGRAISLKTE